MAGLCRIRCDNFDMLQKEFEIWKIDRERNYENDLAELQEDLVNRGLTYSSIRTQAEERLKQKHEAEVKMMKLRMEEAESERKSWVPGGNWRPFILSSIVSVLVGFVVYLLTQITL